ncbi:MAG: ribonuclease HII [Lachnospiraceae bacterium]
MADKMTITEIKKEFDILSDSDPESFIRRFESDERTQVKNLVARAEKKIAALEKEKARMIKMFEFERRYSDYSYICGIDEVGRGPLAGPVVAGAVILPKDCDILYLNDSKQLSEKKREELYSVIMEKAVSVGLGFSSHELIDEINILQATYAAMREAVSKLDPAPDLLLNDAVKIPELTMAQVPIIKGDTLSASISAASIVAKVTRDRMMVKYDEIYPEYGFAKNKGYGSSEHIEALKKYGPTPIHRRSFIKNFV